MILLWIKNQTRGSNGILRNALWLLSDKVIKALCMLLISSLLARHFGPDSYGQLAYAIAFIALFQGASNLGLDAIIVRDLSLDRERAHEITGTVFGLRLLTGAVLWPLASFVAFTLERGDNGGTTLIWLAGGILLFQATDSIDLWFQSQNQSRKSVFPKLLIYLTGSGLRLYLLYLNCPLWVFAAMITADAVLLSIALTYVYRGFPIGQRWAFKSHLAIALLREGWPFMLSGVAILIYARIDQIMIRNLLGDYDLGIYSVALLISGFFAIIPVSLSTALAPYVASQKKTSHSSYIRSIRLIGALFLIISVIICALIYVFSRPIVLLLFGEHYANSAELLKIHIFFNIPIFLGVAQSMWIVNERKGHIYFYKTTSSAALCVGLNFILIPVFGLNAAAFTAVITGLFSAVISNVFWDREYFRIQVGFIARPINAIKLNY